MEQWPRVRQKVLVDNRSKRSVMPEEGLHWEALQKMLSHAQPSINEVLIRELVNGEYLAARENVLMIGNSSTGKTHLATALGFAACAQGKRVRFWSATALVTHILEMRESHELKRFFTQVDKHDLVILDELGYVPFSNGRSGTTL